MQHIDPSKNKTEKSKIPYYSIFGVIFLVFLFVFLWKPLNSARVAYIPLNKTMEKQGKEAKLPAVIGNASVEIIQDQPNLTDAESIDQPIPEDEVVKDELDEAFESKDSGPTYYTIAKGDTLTGILSQAGVNRNDVYQLTKQFKQLANLRVGQQISWVVDENKSLQVFNWYISARDTMVYQREGDAFAQYTEKREGNWQAFTISGQIDNNFIAEARNSGLTLNEILSITKILQWQLDFRRLKKGDRFTVSLLREMIGSRHSTSRILGVRIQNNRRDYYAILADDGNYYDVNGMGLARSFLRYPLAKQAKISSSFNPRRLHPVTGRIAPHNGVDFAVSRGTPVLATGDGEVVIAKSSGSAGNFITIRHGRQYTTRYMHLDKILVRQGQRVRKGDLIGLSGNTGRSTGPHLHYELRIDNKPVNPMTSSLPQAEGLTGKSKSAYLELVKGIKPILAFPSEIKAPIVNNQSNNTLSAD
ncbi:murein DD-endopeptidase MepM [Candidatus Schmidhempelia bombi str. Bimp]|uniref:Murein DD-endopeptidase MepM n=1 Tax=Candidatus Schmidhempelia bombi str. Bimp TaxID=1387197 RepID=A0AB94IF00_9GAMM|nr:murein DD-endopeptidase MepM [Candidatus Schmidhempelia bombi]TEA28088.1 murein DD-endopeptidase MepM [Candidatus Schmidhempelia bombi str. Bimp]